MTSAVPVRMSEADQAAHDLRANRAPLVHSVAEFALEGVREPEDVADRERLVEAVALDDRLARRRVRSRAPAG